MKTRKDKRKFILNETNVYKTCNIYMRKHPDVKIEIEKSPNKTSNSFYLRFYKKGMSASLRISDHDTHLTIDGGGIRNIVIGTTTHIYTVYNKFDETVDALNFKIYKNDFKNILQ